ncbi:SGNH hydrolase-type esterase, partial [Klenkia terrae]
VLAVVAVMAVVVMGAALRVPGPEGGDASRSGPPMGPPTRPTAALFIGDSYTAGAGASSPAQAWSCRAAALLDWTCNLDAQGGTGFVADGRSNTPSFSPLPDRLQSSAQRYLADVVVIDAGRNDRATPAEDVVAVAAAYLAEVRARWPEATLVVVLPAYLTQGPDPADSWQQTVDAGFRDLAVDLGGLVIDPVGERWVEDAAAQRLLDPDGIHPDDAGHALLAERFVADVRQAGLADPPLTDLRTPGS